MVIFIVFVCIHVTLPFLLSLSETDLNTFTPEERHEVKVREGVGAVLLCDPPRHYPGKLISSSYFSAFMRRAG